jgi:hypothetical protein
MMSPTPLPPDFVLPSEQRARGIEATLRFGRRTIWTVYAVAAVVGGGLFLRSRIHHAALMAPINPSFHALMIGIGVFVGVVLAAVEYDGWQLGIGRVRGGIPTGLGALICMLVMVALCAIGGSFVAGQIVEWRAFHGIDPPVAEEVFTVIGRDSSRSGDWLDLQPALGGKSFSISCSDEMYAAVSPGDRLILPTQTGRGGVRRVSLPLVGDLRRT